MQSTKLINILRSLQISEIKRFSEFINSPFFNKNANIIRLFDVIKKFYPEFVDTKFTKEFLYNSIFPGEKYKDETIRNYLSDLTELGEEFLSILNIQRDNFTYTRHLLMELNLRELDRHFEKNMKVAITSLEKRTIKDDTFYYDKFVLESEINLFNEIRGKFSLFEHQKQQDFLLKFFIIKLLKIHCYMLNHNIYISDETYNLIYLDELLEHLKKTSYEDLPILEIYYLKLLLYITQSEENFKKLKKLFLKNVSLLGKEEQHNTFVTLTNYCTRKVQEGNRSFYKDNFELRKLMITGDYYLRNRIDNVMYKNAVKSAMRVKEYDWAEKFTDDFKDKIDLSSRQSAYCYSKALINFHRKNFSKSLEFLSKTGTEDFSNKIEIKNLSLKIYFETNQIEALYSLIDAYRHFLNNNEFEKELHKQRNLNFLKLVQALVKLKENPDDYLIITLKKEIEQTNPIIEKDWLIDKIMEMKIPSEK